MLSDTKDLAALFAAFEKAYPWPKPEAGCMAEEDENGVVTVFSPTGAPKMQMPRDVWDDLRAHCPGV